MTESSHSIGEHPRRYSMSRPAIAILAVGSLLVGGGVGYTLAQRPQTKYELASGFVGCPDDNAVEGVWVSAGQSSGWASFEAGGTASTASYQRVIEQSSYTVHVGCGGTPENWATSDYGTSDATAGQIARFACKSNTTLNIPDRGICDLIGPAR